MQKTYNIFSRIGRFGLVLFVAQRKSTIHWWVNFHFLHSETPVDTNRMNVRIYFIGKVSRMEWIGWANLWWKLYQSDCTEWKMGIKSNAQNDKVAGNFSSPWNIWFSSATIIEDGRPSRVMQAQFWCKGQFSYIHTPFSIFRTTKPAWIATKLPENPK